MYKRKDYKVILWEKIGEKVIRSHHYFFGVAMKHFDGLERVERKFKERYGHTKRKIIHSEVIEIAPIPFKK